MKKKIRIITLCLIALQFAQIGEIHAQKAVLNASDGKLYTIDDVWGNNFNLHYSNNMYKANVKLEKGEHTFVYYIKKTKETYRFTVDIKEGQIYTLTKGKPLKLKEGKVELKNINYEKVNVERNKDDYYWLSNETEVDKVAIIEYRVPNSESINSQSEVNYWLRKIDNIWGNTFYGFNSVWNGALQVALTPGNHELHAFISISKMYGGKVKTIGVKKINVLSYNFEAGKRYTIAFNGNDLDSAHIVELK